MPGKVVAIWLDGFERSLADAMMSELPSLARMREASARFLLDDGSARLTGLTQEHVSSGMSPKDSGRWSIFYFDKDTYGIWQEGPLFAPFPAKMRSNTVVFDFPYFDLSKAGSVRGVVAWGSHNAGTEFSTNPRDLLDELITRHGAYPATEWVYGFVWPSPQRCRTMGSALAQGVAARSRIALWLLKERFSDWDLALIGVSEAHSALEGLWHGVDEQHPLHGHSSSCAAAEGVREVYRAIDRLVGSLAAEFPDATILIFSMHGMGPNHSDVPGAVLLPELLHRYAFGQPFFVQEESWTRAPNGVPLLGDADNWQVITPDLRGVRHRIRDRVVRRAREDAAKHLPEPVKRMLKRVLRAQRGPQALNGSDRRRKPVEWLPAARYQPLWSDMPAFALPSDHDGQVRINLQGRERKGVVPRERYELCCGEIEQMLRDCRDPFSGERAVEAIARPEDGDPLEFSPSRADIYVTWKKNVLCVEHLSLGRVGPVPFRRTGGHTGHHGMAYLRSDRLAPGDYGIRSSFDVVPTLFDLLGERLPEKISGQSLI